jgi:hypothetical protein
VRRVSFAPREELPARVDSDLDGLCRRFCVSLWHETGFAGYCGYLGY